VFEDRRAFLRNIIARPAAIRGFFKLDVVRRTVDGAQVGQHFANRTAATTREINRVVIVCKQGGINSATDAGAAGQRINVRPLRFAGAAFENAGAPTGAAGDAVGEIVIAPDIMNFRRPDITRIFSQVASFTKLHTRPT